MLQIAEVKGFTAVQYHVTGWRKNTGQNTAHQIKVETLPLVVKTECGWGAQWWGVTGTKKMYNIIKKLMNITVSHCFLKSLPTTDF